MRPARLSLAGRGYNMAPNFSLDWPAAKPPCNGFRRFLSNMLEQAGIPCLNLVTQRRTLTVCNGRMVR